MQPGIIKRERVVLAGSAAVQVDRAGGAVACGKKSVRLIEHEGAVRALELVCSCGETTLVELVFDPAESVPAGGKS